MLDFLRDVTGERMEQTVYSRDYDERDTATRDSVSWKLERQQHFKQPYTPSWQALDRGDWDEALRLLEDHRESYGQWIRGDTERGITFQRIRVAEKPIIPYLQWELHAFRIQVELGFEIRMVGPDLIKPFESEGPLPELINVGSETLYRIVYDETGVPDGAVRYTGNEVVSRYAAFMEKLWVRGEDFMSYFEREVAPLPPPRGA